MRRHFQVVSFLMRLMSARTPSTARMIYLFAETVDNQASILSRGVELRDVCPFASLAVLGSEGCNNPGYPGDKAYKKGLEKMGFREEIVVVPFRPLRKAPLNTFNEAESVVSFAKKRRWGEIIVVAPPFHLPRAFISMVSVVLRDYPALRVHAQPGEWLPWNEHAAHSQGTLHAKRIELLAAELERIEKYRKKGDLLSWQNALAYLEKNS